MNPGNQKNNCKREQYQKCYIYIKKAKELAYAVENYDFLEKIIRNELNLFFYVQKFSKKKYEKTVLELKEAQEKNDIHRKTLFLVETLVCATTGNGQDKSGAEMPCARHRSNDLSS